MTGKAKIELLLTMKNKLKTGLSTAKKNVSKSVAGMKTKLNELKSTHMKAFKAMRDEIPLFGRAMQILGNPYILLIGGLLAAGVLFTKATKKAIDFNHEFLHIKQMNLDKPTAEMNKYKKSISNAAFEVGTNLNDTTRAFYDLQSGTGLFGKEAVAVFKKVGKYSIATGADLNDSMNATVKAMKAMGLGVKDIDRYLESNAKTVQVGITTYAELAKVQTEYLGAAAGAGQNIDVANKIFAAFTSIAKNSDTGANMAKTFFQGLKENAAKIGKGLKIDIYKDGKMLGADKILENIANKFSTMSDEQIDKAITKIGGPEGLRGMLTKVQTGADDLLKTFETFDSSKFDLSIALKNAQGDVKVLSGIVKNRWGVVMARMGEVLLPLVAGGLNAINKTMMWAKENWGTLGPILGSVALGLTAIKISSFAASFGFKAMFKSISFGIKSIPVIGWILALIGLLIPIISKVIKKTEGWSKSFQALKSIMKLSIAQMKDSFGNFWDNLKLDIQMSIKKFQGFYQYLRQLFKNIGKAMGLALDGKFSKARNVLTQKIETKAGKELEELKRKRDELNESYKVRSGARKLATETFAKEISIKWKKKTEEEEKKDLITDGADGGLTTANAGADPYAGAGDSVSKITGSAKQIKSIQINIDSFVKGGINTENTTLNKMSAEEIEGYMSDMFMRVINNVERSYS